MKYGVGIDVSKGKSMVSIVSIEGEVVESPFEINHDVEGLDFFENRLNKYPKEDLKIVMEDTGTYHLPLFVFLMEKDYFVVTENALKMKKYLDRGLRKVKTDRKDALKLAEYASENWYKLRKRKLNDQIYDDLKFLSRQYSCQMSIQTKQKVDFSNLCDLLFPGYYQLLNGNNFLLGLEIFKTYYHPNEVKKKKQPQFIKEIAKIAKKLGQERAGITLATKIYNLAFTTISPRPNNRYAKLSAESQADSLIITIKKSNLIITEMEKLARELPEYEVIREIPGCGDKLTTRMIAEIGNIEKYQNAGSIIAYAGIDAPPYQSGKYEATNNRRISKRGNKYLRKCGYEIMQAIMIVKESEIYEYIIKKEQEGKPRKVAKIAGLNKFLRIYYGKVKEVYQK